MVLELEDMDLDALEHTMGCVPLKRGMLLIDALVALALVGSRAEGKRAMGKRDKDGKVVVPSIVRLNNFRNPPIEELDFALDADVCPDGRHVFLFVGKKVGMARLDAPSGRLIQMTLDKLGQVMARP